MSNSPIRLTGIVKRYPAFTLGPVTSTIAPGVTALLGTNGAGKSTLLKILSGSLKPDGGTVEGSRAIGYLPQDFTAAKGVRVREYLTYVAWCRTTRGSRPGWNAIEDAVERVNLTDRIDAKIGTLSGGMLRRLGVAQALIGSQYTLLLDEPTVGLDPIQRAELRDLLTDLGGSMSILVSTHLSEDVAAIADHVLVLHDGSIVFEGSVTEMSQLAGAAPVSGSTIESAFLTLCRQAYGDG